MAAWPNRARPAGARYQDVEVETLRASVKPGPTVITISGPDLSVVRHCPVWIALAAFARTDGRIAAAARGLDDIDL